MMMALEEQYGGAEELLQMDSQHKVTKHSSAYMLVYIRESDGERILCDVDEKDLVEHLQIRLKKEQEEKERKRKEKAEANLYTIIKVARHEDLVEQIQKGFYFDLVDHHKVHRFGVQKQMPFTLFKEEVAKEFDIPVQFQRFWLWAERKNYTYRLDRPLTRQEEAQTVGQLREISDLAYNTELKLFLEVVLGKDMQPVLPPDKMDDDILLFFKLYDPFKEEISYVGSLLGNGNGKPADILAKLNEMAGFPLDKEIQLFEEIRYYPRVECKRVDKGLTFFDNQLEDGDIIWVQQSLDIQSICPHPDVYSFLNYIQNRQVVRFRSFSYPKEDEFHLLLSKENNYDEVVGSIASHIGLDDPSRIRLTPHNCYSLRPHPWAIKFRGVNRLADMLVHYNQASDILYYEVLDMPLPELEGVKILRVAFYNASNDEIGVHNTRLTEQSTVEDVLLDLKSKVELSHPDAELRLLLVNNHKICKIFQPTEKIQHINDPFWLVRAEEIPEEEKNLDPSDQLISVAHFKNHKTQDPTFFGKPFLLLIHEGETLAEVKGRIQKKSHVPDDEFSQLKFASHFLSQPQKCHFFRDSDLLANHFPKKDVYGAWEEFLILLHTSKAKAPQTSRASEGLKIYN